MGEKRGHATHDTLTLRGTGFTREPPSWLADSSSLASIFKAPLPFAQGSGKALVNPKVLESVSDHVPYI